MELFVVKRVKVKEGDAPDVLSIGIQNPSDSSVLWIFKDIDSQGAFENVVESLKKDLEKVALEGEKLWKKIKEEAEGTAVLAPGMDPEKAWEVFEKADEDEIFHMFNNLPDRDRKAVANYVFTHLNVFKGKAMYFSQHYDYSSNLLIKD